MINIAKARIYSLSFQTVPTPEDMILDQIIDEFQNLRGEVQRLTNLVGIKWKDVAAKLLLIPKEIRPDPYKNRPKVGYTDNGNI
jgi:Tfp pilus assembly PilM family ATPase